MTVTQSQASGVLREWRSALLVGGLLCLGLGIVVLVWPSQTLLLLTVVVGIGLILLGAAWLVGAADRQAPGSQRALRGLGGLLYLAAGIVVLLNPHAALRTFAVIVAVSWIVVGILEAVTAISGRIEGRTRSVVLSLLNIAFGVILLAWPRPTVLLLAWLTGLWLVVVGLAQLYFASRAGKAAKAVTPEPRG